jgi:hypothetical protein
MAVKLWPLTLKEKSRQGAVEESAKETIWPHKVKLSLCLTY